MNIVQELLKFDRGDIKTPTKDFRMTLDKLGNTAFVFPLIALSPDVASEIQEDMFEMRMSKKSKGIEMKQTIYNGKLKTLTNGCPEVFKNKEILKKFGARTPHELIEILLTPGEIDTLKEQIDSISGYDKEEEIEEEVKN